MYTDGQAVAATQHNTYLFVSYFWFYLGNIKLSKWLIWWNTGEIRGNLLKDIAHLFLQVSLLMNMSVEGSRLIDQSSLWKKPGIRVRGKAFSLVGHWLNDILSHCSYQINCRSKEYTETYRSTLCIFLVIVLVKILPWLVQNRCDQKLFLSLCQWAAVNHSPYFSYYQLSDKVIPRLAEQHELFYPPCW